MIPDIPLVKGDVQNLFGALLRLYVVADRDDVVDKTVHIHGIGQEAGRIVFLISVVLMNGNVIHKVIGMIQHCGLPLIARVHT